MDVEVVVVLLVVGGEIAGFDDAASCIRQLHFHPPPVRAISFETRTTALLPPLPLLTRCNSETSCLFERAPRRRTTESYVRYTRTARTWSVSTTELRGERDKESRKRKGRVVYSSCLEILQTRVKQRQIPSSHPFRFSLEPRRSYNT